jgi:hypothetical protein
MKTLNALSRIHPAGALHEAAAPGSYQAIIGGLISEMARLVSTTETRKFSPPFKLVIIDNRGEVVFTGEVGRSGKLRRSGPLCRVRRSHFPANALITDGSLATRTFRIDRPVYRTLYR